MIVKLGRLADIQIGYQVKGKITQQADGTHWLVQTSDVTPAGEVAWESLARFTPVRKDVDRYALTDDEILFLAKGARRTTALIRNPRPHTLAVSTFFVLRVRDEAVELPEYLAWYLQVGARDAVAALAHQGVTIPFVSKEALTDFPVILPDSATQRRITHLDALLCKERRLTTELLVQRSRLVNALAQRVLAGGGD
jgi:restriction endonuclease S subunit